MFYNLPTMAFGRKQEMKKKNPQSVLDHCTNQYTVNLCLPKWDLLTEYCLCWKGLLNTYTEQTELTSLGSVKSGLLATVQRTTRQTADTTQTTATMTYGYRANRREYLSKNRHLVCGKKSISRYCLNKH